MPSSGIFWSLAIFENQDQVQVHSQDQSKVFTISQIFFPSKAPVIKCPDSVQKEFFYM